MPYSLPRYALTYVLAMIGLMVINLVLELATGLSAGAGASTVVPPLLAAMFEGQRVVRLTGGVVPQKAGLWRAAAAMTLVAAAITLVVLVVMWLVPSLRGVFAAVPLGLLVAVFAVLMLVTLLVNRFALGMGIRNELRRAETK